MRLIEKKDRVDGRPVHRFAHSVQRNAHAARLHIRTFLQGLADFKIVAWFTLFSADIIIVIPTMFLFVVGYPFPLCYVSMAGYLGITQMPLWVGVYRRIKHENALARVMAEGWEAPRSTTGKPKSTEKLVDEYQKLLNKK